MVGGGVGGSNIINSVIFFTFTGLIQHVFVDQMDFNPESNGTRSASPRTDCLIKGNPGLLFAR